MMDDLTKTITDDFCDSFYSDPEAYLSSGWFRSLVANGYLPEGVDPGDPRVVGIIDRCRGAAKGANT